VGVPTVFNLLGPMANPGRVRRQVIGVANPQVADRMLASLRLHGSISSWVVHGQGLDELTTTGPSSVLELRHGAVRSFVVDPVDLGVAPAIPEELVGGTPAINAEAVRRVLAGDRGAHRDIVVLNAAAGLVVADAASDLAAAIPMAMESIDSGSAARVLERLVVISNDRRPNE
jgi:anthranilate phosphoribosyltransferase